MHEHKHTTPSETIYFVDSNNEEPTIREATVTARSGARLHINYPVNESVVSRSIHSSEGHSPIDLTAIALDMIPPADDGEERTVQAAVNELISGPHRQELAARLGGVTLAEFVTRPRTPEDLGVESVADIVGDESKPGSNLWKVQELIDGYLEGMYTEGVHNSIHLARETADMSVVTAAEAKAARSQIQENNRDALNMLYDHFGVDYNESKIYEKSHPDARELKTIYPVPTYGISFVETAVLPKNEDIRADSMPNPYIEVVIGHPAYGTEADGYSAAI